MARAPCPFGVRPIASYSINSAMVKQSWVSTNDRSDSSTPALCSARCHATRAAFEIQDVALRHRQKILRMRGGLDVDRLAHRLRGFGVREHQRGGAVRHQRTIGALQRSRHERILLALGAAERVAEILAQLRVGIGRRRCDGSWRRSWPARRTGRRISGNRPARSCRTRRRSPPGYRRPRANTTHAAGCGRSPAAGVRVICSTPTTSTIRAAFAAIDFDRLMHRRRPGRAGILDPCRRLEPQLRVGLQAPARR